METQNMKLVVGLGNPGEKYQGSRHNAGFMFLDYLAQNKSWSQSKLGLLQYTWLKLNGLKLELIKPQTCMNRSGEAVNYVLKKHPQFKTEDIYVVHDDLDLELGNYKLQFGTGPRQHNGLLSIYETLNTDRFWHLRLGIDSRQGERKIPPDKYVLTKFKQDEQDTINQTLKNASQKLREGFRHA